MKIKIIRCVQHVGTRRRIINRVFFANFYGAYCRQPQNPEKAATPWAEFVDFGEASNLGSFPFPVLNIESATEAWS